MSAKISLVTGQITINDGGSFLLTAADGSIDDRRAQGLFVRDTRLISHYQISLDRQPLTLLTSSAITHRVARYEFTNPELLTARGIVPAKKLLVSVRRDIMGGMHEDISIVNHHQHRVEIQLMLKIRSDFVDVSRVKAQELFTQGRMETTWADEKLANIYRNGEFTRGLRLESEGASSPRYSNGRLVFDIALEPNQNWQTCLNFIALVDGEELVPQHTDAAIDATPAGVQMASFLELATHLRSSNRDVEQSYERAVSDLAALRIPVDGGNTVWIPAAGIPWFVAVFGRDPLIASLQTMSVAPNLAQGTLLKLAQLQATEFDDWRDAEPGKILHELRLGELAQLGQIPSAPYYGAIDTTLLWIITLAETYNWTGDRELLDRGFTALEKALTWIDKYADLDGDGFVEYCSRSQHGIQNQGWKDSGDAIRAADGTLVTAPIALCETQGQVYDAWRRAADLYDVLGKTDRARALRQQADGLYVRFNDRFWMADEGFYCLGLDANKQQIRSIASNAGQLLWSGIVPVDRAQQLVERLFKPDLWCGWGIRTLSSNHPAYDPIGYHTGSVWPHDNSFIAAGLKRYGYHAQANQIAAGIFAAASMFQSNQLPELFGGIDRTPENFPVPYVDANIPQAWAAGAIPWLISSILGLVAYAPDRRLQVQAVLPEWLPDLQLKNIHVGDAQVDLDFWRQGDRTYWKVVRQVGELEVFENT
ncbi:glycogen debranching N-terminal domain-containing protein [Chamaesiphon sp. GL140_3_metabinner_50]|uniref:amylo-alpha-1,6-glucosidase n=1 Tax=Chamaesiphon sp. GL140_3_metabinner_50 TaxID=2970812 RepID=UPI0025DF6419|nr:glycogen debranching N-terminal domain-containing protein [Chamaesiphon sp. GL140_3_metabinner_50]